MATTTTEAPASQADGTPVSGLPPAPFHLCLDGLDGLDDGIDEDCDAVDAILDCEFADGPDDDAFFANADDALVVSDELSRSELIDLEVIFSSDNLRSHAEVPEPDGFGLPSHDCIVYRAVAPANVRTEPGAEPFIELVTVSGTTLSDLQYTAVAVARRLQDATVAVSKRTWSVDATGRVVVTRTVHEIGADWRGFSLARTRGMGRELDVRIVRANPEVLGFWARDLAEEALVAAERRLPVPAKVPSESRAVRVTELPVARWQRLNAADEVARGAA